MSRGLKVWGVSASALGFGGDTTERLEAFIDQTGVTFPVVRDTESSYMPLFGAVPERPISPFPLDVLIDPDGRLVSVRGEYDPEALRREIERYLP